MFFFESFEVTKYLTMKIKALCIGINYYLGINNLKSCINDAKDWQKLFIKSFNIPKEHITKLTFGAETNAQNIKKELKNLIISLSDGDLGVFVFSGHGSRKKKTINGETVYQESIRARNRSISEKEIQKILDTINPNAQFIAIIDSCHAGGVDLEEKIVNFKTNNISLEVKTYKTTYSEKEAPSQKRIYKKIMKPMNNNFITIAACKPEELAYGDAFGSEGNFRMNGVLSYHAIEQIKRNPHITYRNLINNLQNFLPNEAKQHFQTPQLVGDIDMIDKKVFKL